MHKSERMGAAVLSCGRKVCGIGKPHTATELGMKFLRCPECRSFRLPELNHVGDEVEIDAKGGIGFILQMLFGLRMVWLKANLPIICNDKISILDVGCGDGQFLQYLSRRGYHSLTGIEHNENRRKNALLHGIDVLSELGGLGEQQYDLIILWHVLEHIENPIFVLNCLSRNLAPNGVILVSIPNHIGWQTRIFGRFSCYLDYGRHLWYWDWNIIEAVQAEMLDFNVRVVNGRNYEYETFGWLDSMASWLLQSTNSIHCKLKKGIGSPFQKAVVSLVAIVLSPLALLLALATPMKYGSTLTFAISRNGMAVPDANC